MPGARRRERAQVWYADGLCFSCTRCARCCSGAPGYVWVEPDDIARMAEHLGLGQDEFFQHYCRRVWWRVSLQERPVGDCVLLGAQGCSAYPVRPAQCRSFPFWGDNLASPERWQQVLRRCPGAGRGRLHTREQIERLLAGDGET